MTLVNKPAPKFEATAVVNGSEVVKGFSLSQFQGEKYVVFFFFPKAFTSVCSSEIVAFQEQLGEFEKRGCAVVACSTDSEDSHLAWLSKPMSEGGIGGVTYPVVSDLSKAIASNYGVLGGEYDYTDDGELTFVGVPIALRGTFLINKNGVVKHEYINDFPLGRNVDDTLRMLDALIHLEENGEVCPANWKKG